MTSWALVAVLLLSATATAQTIDMTLIDDVDTSFVTRVPVSGARCMAVHDVVDLLAIGHDGVSFYKLDHAGAPGEKPIATLPLDAQPRNMVFHPKHPVLYVWQDVAAGSEATFPSVVVFRMDGDAAKQVQAIDLGDGVATGRTVGEIALDDGGTRLYVGGLRAERLINAEPTILAGIGYFEVGEDGLLVMDGNEPKLTSIHSGNFHGDTIAGGFAPISDGVVIVGGRYGPLTVNLRDVRQRFQEFYAWPARYARRIAKHPTLPVVYTGCYDESYIHCFQHADGYVTLAPQTSSTSGPFTPPVVMAKRKLIAFGAVNAVRFLRLDEQGMFTGECFRTRVTGARITAMAYADRFDTLYVAEETP